MTMHPVTPARIDANWRAIQIELDAPRPSWVERSLSRFGASSATARLVAATPALRRSWLGSLVAVIVVGLSAADASRPRDSLFVLLLLAPLVPVFGVSLAYGPAADPAHEISLATPMRGLRLVMVRSLTVLVVAAATLCGAALLAPAPAPLALAWLLPALACTASALALMTFTSPRRAAGATALGWLLLVAVAAAGSGDRLQAFGAGGQVLAVVAAAAMAALVHTRRERFDLLAAQR